VEQWEKEKGMETTLFKKNSIQDSVGNEESGYPVPDLNKTKTNVTKELSNAHKKKKPSKKKSGKYSLRNSWRRY
jgi:hypothetical protein